MNSKQSKLKQVVALLTAVVVALTGTPMTAYAGMTGNGSGSSPGMNGEGHARMPGAMVGIVTVENTKELQESYEDQTQSVKDRLGPAEIALFDLYITSMPDHGMSAGAVETFSFITRDRTGAESVKSLNNFYGYTKGKGKKIKPSNIYETTRETEFKGWNSCGITKKLLADKNWKDKSMTRAQLKKIVDAVPESEWKGAINSLVSAFGKTEDITESFKKITPSDGSQKSEALYMELLLVLNKMNNNTHWDACNTYRDQRNREGATHFIVVEAYSIYGIASGTGMPVWWYTYPAYEGEIYKKDWKKFQKVNRKSYAYRSNLDKFQEEDKKCAKKAINGASVKSRGLYLTESLWYKKWIARYCLMPADLDGKQTGGSGYTFMADFGKKEPTQAYPKGKICLTVTSPNSKPDLKDKNNYPYPKTVDNKSKNTAKITVSLVQKEHRADIIKVFKQETKKGKKLQLTLKLSVDCPEGAGKSDNLFDTVTIPKELKRNSTIKLTGDKDDKTYNITIKDITEAQFIKLMDAKTDANKIIWCDNDVKVIADKSGKGKVINKYKATGKLYWEDKIECDLTSSGFSKGSKGTKTAYDFASWKTSIKPKKKPPVKPGEPTPTPSEDPEPGKDSFYSEPENTYCEIKDRTPSSERFEAMAGVPTTEDLYASFGGSEFMVNMDVEETKSAPGTRTYKLTYTCPNCIEDDEKCVISKTTHTCNHKVKDAVPAVKDDKGNVITPGKPAEYKDFTYSCGGSCSKCGKKCKGDTHKCGHATGAVGVGCQVSQKINNKHPHTCTWTGTVTQKIDECSYIDIKALDLWRTNKLIIDGNEELFSNAKQTFDPLTGYRAFYDQEGYKDGNGRLKFSTNLTNTSCWGNDSLAKTNNAKMKKTDCDKAATEWMNSVVSGKKVKAKVVSDFLVLNTTEGYQSASYHDYESDEVSITKNKFTTGSQAKTIGGETITFKKIPKWSEMWESNANSSYNWDPEHIVRSGYNGDFAHPNTKLDNPKKITTASDPSALLGTVPNMKEIKGGAPGGVGMSNQRFTFTGLNIIDSTKSDGTWSDSDLVEPVANGFYETGNCYLQADKDVSYKTTEEGNDYATESDGKTFKEEAVYCEGQEKVNDIVVHNPVSAQYATIICNDKKYDMRTAKSLATGGDPVDEDDQEVCPRDASCEYQVLDCHERCEEHNDSCYEEAIYCSINLF